MTNINKLYTYPIDEELTIDLYYKIVEKKKHHELIRVLKLLIPFIKVAKTFYIIVEEKLGGNSINGDYNMSKLLVSDEL